MTNEATFFEAYRECALDLLPEYEAATEDPLPEVPDFAPETLGRMRMDCVKFLHMDPGSKVTAFLDSLTDDELKRAGTDFWLTRNRHGGGFWDGGWDYRDYGGPDWGHALDKRAKTFGEYDLTVGDDNLIWGM